jgi:hypothetical protein
MIDIRTESLMSFSAAAKFVASRFRDSQDGRTIHLATLYRWSSKGVRGTRLETICIGGKRVTSEEALQRFFERLAGESDATLGSGAVPSPVLPTAPSDAKGRQRRQRRIAAAERELERLGV